MKLRFGSLKKMNKINRPLAKLRKKREEIQIKSEMKEEILQFVSLK
jgi:hypothetical protein